ncbi:response regulator receiver domain [Shewanella sp. TC10]|uniref:response regulator receiver domain n=1 Tax=Shewanella sp. TC10 TaxID=1419739 RepID=UPI00129E6938|nr:response regulator receiver domain [Shewanella sp. TC10]
MSAFETYCSDIVKEYVQTVLIIDDGAGLQKKQQIVNDADIQDPDDDIQDPLITAEAPLVTKLEGDQDDDIGEEESSHPLRTLELTNAFYDLGIVAGLFQPQITNGDDPDLFANSVKSASATADIIVLDWMLSEHDTRYSKALVKQILKQDSISGGRLRTIVIYTGEPALNNLRDELWDYLADTNLDNSLDFEISSENLNIVFYNKIDSINGLRPVSEEELPNTAIKEFATLVNGLVPAFAMKAAATIRHSTGKITTRFGSELDTGYLSHRVLLPNPADSEVFMLENFVSYIRSVLAISQVDRATLGEKIVESWITHNENHLSKKILFKDKCYSISNNGLKDLAKNGFEKDLARVISNNTPDDISGSFTDPTKACFEQAISIFDFHEGTSSQESSIALSILTSFRRTYKDVEGLQKPYLTQGSLVYSVKSNQFLLCVTPKCDTARVDGSSKFSFAILERKLIDKKFDLIVPLMNEVSDYIKTALASKSESLVGEIIDFQLVRTGPFIRHSAHEKLDNIKKLLDFEDRVCLSTSDKFYKLEHIDFSSDSNRRVNTNMTEDGNLAFWDNEINEYIWLGDLEDLDSQKRVSKLVGNLNRIGNDEVEWLRRRNT